MNRREMLAASLAIPLLGLETARNPKPWMVRFESYTGPKDKNPLDRVWADRVIEEHATVLWPMQLDGKFVTKIDRMLVNDYCCLSDATPVWFTASLTESWKEDYTWYGPVSLYRDKMYLRDGRIKFHYYLCRDDFSMIFEKCS